MRLWLLVSFAVTAGALRLHQHSAAPQQCVDLQCPATSFDYGKKRIVNEETLSSEPCRDCSQCAAAGYSVCLKPRLLNRSKRQASTQQMSTCSCAHAVPANCHNRLASTTHPANITMQLYNVCYHSALQAPVAALAVNSKKNVIVTVEPFWEEPYWKDLDLENLTLTYSYVVKLPDHCDGDVMTKEDTSGVPTHICTAQLRIGMSTEDKAGEDEYEHSENYQYDDDLPPEVDFDRDVFAGATHVNFTYKVSVRRPRQLRVRPGSTDPFEDIVTVVESETLVHDMKPEIFGTGLEDAGVAQGAEVHKEPIKGADVTKEDKVAEASVVEESEETVSEEQGEAENIPGTDFFADDAQKKKEEDGEKEHEEEEKEENEVKEDEEEGDEADEAEEEKLAAEAAKESGEKKEDEEKEDKDGDEEKKDEEEEKKEDEKEGEEAEKKEGEEEVVKELDGVKEDEVKEDEEGNEDGSGSGSEEEDDEDEEEEGKPWHSHIRDFFSTESRWHLARWVFAVTVAGSIIFICVVCGARRWLVRKKHHQKTANGVRYEAASQSTSHQLPAAEQPLLDDAAKKVDIETSMDEIAYRYNSATLSLKNIAASDIDICALVGKGRFGSIHRGMWHTETGGTQDVTVYWLQEIATGVETLCRRKIFHPTLCTANILVGDRGHIRISGLGLCEHRALTARKDEKTPKTMRWRSPRLLQAVRDTRLEEADLVWSLGVVLWEISSLGGTPYARIRDDAELMLRIPKETARIDHPNYLGPAMKSLIDECLTVDPVKRIDLETAVKRIECLAVDAQKHLLLFLPFDEAADEPARASTSTFIYAPILPQLE
ncbi:unnamed protein product, partial [Mesorhabditis spiculigera]